MEKPVKVKKKLSKKFSVQTLLIILCAVIVAVCLFIIFKPDDMTISMPKINVSTSEVGEKMPKIDFEKIFGGIGSLFTGGIKQQNKTLIDEEQAREKAVNKFKELGEEVNKDSLKVYEIDRDNQKDYFIKSEKNTMEIRKSDGQIVRVNGNKTVDGVEIVKIEGQTGKQISKEQAIRAAIEQFKKLGENAKESDLTVKEIVQNGEKYYFIRSRENSIQIQINGGKIVRINNVNV